MLRNTIALMATGFAAGTALTVATLGPTASPVVADQADHAYMVAQKANVAATTFRLDKSDLHDIDVGANGTMRIPFPPDMSSTSFAGSRPRRSCCLIVGIR